MVLGGVPELRCDTGEAAVKVGKVNEVGSWFVGLKSVSKEHYTIRSWLDLLVQLSGGSYRLWAGFPGNGIMDHLTLMAGKRVGYWSETSLSPSK